MTHVVALLCLIHLIRLTHLCMCVCTSMCGGVYDVQKFVDILHGICKALFFCYCNFSLDANSVQNSPTDENSLVPVSQTYSLL